MNFVECYLEMKDEDVFRDELSRKLNRSLEGDAEGIFLMEEVIWDWLSRNGFV